MAPCHFKKPHRQRYASTIRKTYPELPLGSTNFSLIRRGHGLENSYALNPTSSSPISLLWDIFLDTLLDTLSKFQAFPNFIEIYAWADDVLLLIPFDRNDTASLTTTIEKILHEADLWAAANKASFGKDKTKLVTFFSGNLPRINIALEVQNFGKIEQVNKIKFLGVFFDDKLTFNDHLQYICDKIRSCLFSLRSYAKKVLPKLFYSLPVWFKVFDKKLAMAKLTRILRVAALLSVRCQRSVASEILFPLAELLPPDLLVKRETARRLLSTIQSTFFDSEDLNELLTPKTDNSFRLRALLLEKLGISGDQLCVLHSSAKTNENTKPWERVRLRVTLDGNNRFAEFQSGDLVAYSDGSKTEEGVGASAVLYQFPDLIRPIKSISLFTSLGFRLPSRDCGFVQSPGTMLEFMYLSLHSAQKMPHFCRQPICPTRN